MKFTYTILLTSIICLCSYQSEAQFLKKLGEKVSKKVEQTVERKAEQKAEKSTESAMDSLFAPSNKGNTKNAEADQKRAEAMMQAIMNTEPVDVADRYSFRVIATMEIESYSKRKTETQTMKQGYGTGALYIEMDNSPDNPIITDLENEAMIMLDTKKNTAQVMSLSWMKKMGAYEDEDDYQMEDADISVGKTGNTKTIAGYNCEEYIITTDEGKTHAWFTSEVNFDYDDYLNGFTNMFGKKKETNPMLQLTGMSRGYVMEMTAFDKKGEKTTKMVVTDISENEKNISMSQFEVQSLMSGAGGN
ncbi:DUF4412 domain-containing protein [Roseivirga sp. BDSF3-8]|uniref:DUF4412 domain-containing protein n=1 Tax=Roseivirga sp. BDSF3-8 TaxID=3241598 RepID=UPI00353221BC